MASILIIDDDPTIREMFVRALLHLAPSDQASNGAEALRLLNAKKYGVILLDLHMPGVDGFSVLHTLATKGGPNRDTAVYVISADLSDNARIRALRRHAVFFLTKPVPIATLVGFVESSLRKSVARGQTPSKATPAIAPWSAMAAASAFPSRTTTPASEGDGSYERVAVLPPAPPAPDSSTGRSQWNLGAVSPPRPPPGRSTASFVAGSGFSDPRTTGAGYAPHAAPPASTDARIPPPPPSSTSLDPSRPSGGRSIGHWAPASTHGGEGGHGARPSAEPGERRGSAPGAAPAARPPSPVPAVASPAVLGANPLTLRKPGT